MFNLDQAIDELVGTFTDPIVVHQGGWGDTLPDWVKQQITIERLAENMRATKEGNGHKGTDAEALAYLYTACLTAPPDDEWTRIYIYIARKEYEKASRGEFPSDLRIESLSDYEMQELNELKSWIYDKRVRFRKERARQERKEAERAKPRQLVFSFEGLTKERR